MPTLTGLGMEVIISIDPIRPNISSIQVIIPKFNAVIMPW